jgi:phage terminase Nu1 subunit (DNA packaging protein)
MARSKPTEPGADEIRLAELRLEMGWTAWVAEKWLQRGMPVVKTPSFRGDDYRVSRKAVLRWFAAELEKVYALVRPAADAEVDDDGRPILFEVERARLTKEQADKTELENRAARRELVGRARVESALAVMDLALKDRLLTVPMACAPEALDAAREGGVPAAADVIARHIGAALSDVAGAEVVARATA